MTRRPSSDVLRALRWLAILAVGGLLLLLGPSLVASGRGRGAAPAPVYLSRALGQGGPAARPETMTVAAASFEGGVRRLARIRPVAMPMPPELGVAESTRVGRVALSDPAVQRARAKSGSPPGPNMPNAIQNFAGLDFNTWGAGYPPDTNGDVGPNDYVQAVNTSIGIFSKTGTGLAAFTFNALWLNAGSGTPCDTNNNGDPVALYDAQADRFIVADFAWTNADAGPHYECIAASKTGDPTGDWWLYAVRADDDANPWLNDYPKLGVWPDGIYMSANMFACSNNCGSANYEGARVWAFNRDDLYSGAALRVVRFDAGGGYFTLLPSNLRAPASGVQTLTAPFTVYLPAIFNGQSARPNYFVSNDFVCCSLDVFKFHVDWANPLASTFSSPIQVAEDSFSEPGSVPESDGAPALDSLGSRLMMQNQYRNIGGSESLWIAHTADDAPTGIRWYQLDVTGGTVATTPVQQGTYRPDSAYRWMPSLAVDKFGNMAVGYSVSNSGQHPDIRYAGRLASDPLGTLGQAETTLVTGGGSQTSCFGGTCTRWGDYSAMTVDPVDDCTFWYTTEYYAGDGGDWQTRIGSFRFAGC